MEKQKNNKKLNGKDLLNTGIFTAIYFLINLLVAAALGLIPVVSMLIPLVSSLILGIPMMLYFIRIKKFGMVLITYIVYGVFLTLAGVGIYSLIFGTICALIAELILRSGKYQSANRAVLAFAVVSIGANANVLQMVVAGGKALAEKAATYGTDYVNTIAGYYERGWVLPVIFASAFIGGLFGGLLGKAVFKKHFIRSGLV
ncbi:MAG TPA: MptD family putative ECF transporter S component [Clostridiales bacterium]|nr:MptD family putative ECF transporter S component [Clostridiales bacterium]